MLLDSFNQNQNGFRILCLGDSFTEGDGAPSDSSWVKELTRKLDENFDTNFLVYNAGVCGSDVYFDNKILENVLYKTFKPDFVIQAINASDVTDIIYRGGQDRFNTDGTTSCKDCPKWEKLYQYSYLFRGLIRTIGGYD